MYVFCSKSHQQEVVASVMESRPVLGPVLLGAYSSGKTPTFTPTGNFVSKLPHCFKNSSIYPMSYTRQSLRDKRKMFAFCQPAD